MDRLAIGRPRRRRLYLPADRVTDKHVAVDELVRIVDFTPLTPQVLSPVAVGAGVSRYPTSCPEFDVWVLRPDAGVVALPAAEMPRIALVTEGEATFSDADDTLRLTRGRAVFVPATSGPITVTGDATVFVGSPGLLG